MKHTAQIAIAAFFALAGNLSAQENIAISVKNPLGFERREVAAIPVKDIAAFLKGKQEKDIRIKNGTTGALGTLQWIDYNADGKSDELLFLAIVPADSAVDYTLVADTGSPAEESKTTTFSRFVPERTDDYAWENDRVAFRTYGPDAQKRAEQKRENGTLSSGIDLWLKSTSQPVINKWYKGYTTDPGYYHTDHGEGYDPYHVGASRGTGGTGIWEKDNLLVSRNFVTYKTIATGPLRTVFELTYAPYSAYKVKETKRISLDLASNFSKFQVTYTSDKPLPNYAVGITLHNNEGIPVLMTENGIFAHHEKIDGFYLGEGLILDPSVIQKAFANKSDKTDQSNLLVLTKPAKTLTYYAGFAWSQSGQVTDTADWEGQLKKQSQIIANPLQIILK